MATPVPSIKPSKVFRSAWADTAEKQTNSRIDVMMAIDFFICSLRFSVNEGAVLNYLRFYSSMTPERQKPSKIS
jgi:hypothetical protein